MLDQALRAVEKYCDSCVPESLRGQIRIECSRRGEAITIVERRPPWKPEFGREWSTVKVAQLRYDDSNRAWSLRWSDSNGRWHQYDLVPPSRTIEPLIAEVEADPTGIFWG